MSDTYYEFIWLGCPKPQLNPKLARPNLARVGLGQSGFRPDPGCTSTLNCKLAVYSGMLGVHKSMTTTGRYCFLTFPLQVNKSLVATI